MRLPLPASLEEGRAAMGLDPFIPMTSPPEVWPSPPNTPPPSLAEAVAKMILPAASQINPQLQIHDINPHHPVWRRWLQAVGPQAALQAARSLSQAELHDNGFLDPVPEQLEWDPIESWAWDELVALEADIEQSLAFQREQWLASGSVHSDTEVDVREGFVPST